MTDQYQWQGALAAAERAIRAGQITEAESSLQIALTHTSTFEPADPARIPILEAFLRCCERAITSAEKNFRSQWNIHTTHSSDDQARLQEHDKIRQYLYNCRLSAYHLFLHSQVSQLGEDDAEVVVTLLKMAHFEWDRNEFKSFPVLHQALAICQRTLGADHPDTLAIVWQLAASYHTLVSYKEAIPFWQRLLDYADRTGRQTFGVVRREVPDLIFKLANAYNGVRLHSEAKQHWLRYLAVTQHNPEQQTIHYPTWIGGTRLNAYYGVGRAALAQEEWGEAADYLSHAVERHRMFPNYIVDDGNGLSRVNLASGIAVYAEALAQVGDHGGALQLCEEAIRLYQRKDRQYVSLLVTYAATLRALGSEHKAATVEYEASTLKESMKAKMRRLRKRSRRTPDSVNQ